MISSRYVILYNAPTDTYAVTFIVDVHTNLIVSLEKMSFLVN